MLTSWCCVRVAVSGTQDTDAGAGQPWRSLGDGQFESDLLGHRVGAGK
jgi:hypothetical protein